MTRNDAAATATTTEPPATHQWAAGDRARIRPVHADVRTWFFGADKSEPEAIPLEPGDVITLVRRATDIEWYFRSPKLPGLSIVDEPSIEPVTGATP